MFQGRSLAQIRGGGQCLLSKYQVAISVLLLGIINLKNHKNWKSQGGQLPPLPPPPPPAGYGPVFCRHPGNRTVTAGDGFSPPPPTPFWMAAQNDNLQAVISPYAFSTSTDVDLGLGRYVFHSTYIYRPNADANRMGPTRDGFSPPPPPPPTNTHFSEEGWGAPKTHSSKNRSPWNAIWGPRGFFLDLRPGAILRATARPRQFKKTTCDLCCFNFLMKKSDLVTWGLEKQWPCDLRGDPSWASYRPYIEPPERAAPPRWFPHVN